MQGPIHVKSEIGPLQRSCFTARGGSWSILCRMRWNACFLTIFPICTVRSRSMTGSCSFCEKTAQRSYSWRI